MRNRRGRQRRRTVMASLVIYLLALVGVVIFSLLHVDELWTPNIQVKVFSPSAVPTLTGK